MNLQSIQSSKALKLNSHQQNKVLESYEKSKSCGTSFVSSVNDSDKYNVKVKIHPILCHSVFCLQCQKIKRAKLWYKLLKFAKKKQLRMMTLTYLNDDSNTPLDIINNYSHDFNLFMLKLNRRGYKFNYFKVIEFTKRQAIHFHLIVDTYIPQTLISQLWRDVTGHSWLTWISYPEKHNKIINYSLKYVIKSYNGSQELFAAFNIRRYSFSKYTFNFSTNKNLNPDNNFKFDFHHIFYKKTDLVEYYLHLYGRLSSQGFLDKYPNIEFL